MLGVGTVKFQLGFQGDAISKPTLYALFYGIARGINIIVQELKNEIVSCVCNREVFGKYFIQSLVLPFLGRGI
jgi:hypothetical protein